MIGFTNRNSLKHEGSCRPELGAGCVSLIPGAGASWQGRGAGFYYTYLSRLS